MPDSPEKQVLNQLFPEESYPVEVMDQEPKADPEVESLIQRVERDIYLAKPITDDAGQPLVANPGPTNPIITLPIGQSSYLYGLTQKVSESIRWLAEWCLRLIKIFGKQAVFRDE